MQCLHDADSRPFIVSHSPLCLHSSSIVDTGIVVNDNLRIALRQKSFFSRDKVGGLHKLIQMLLKTPTIVSIPNSLAKQRKVLIQVLSYDHWFYLHRKLFVSGPNLMSRRMQGLDECFDCPTSFKPVFVFVSNANNSAAN